LAPLVSDSILCIINDGLQAVIRTSWTNRNPGRHFMVVLHLWYDPPMCQRFVQIIIGLLRSRNDLEEILAMVEEKQRKLLKFLIIRRAIIEELERLPRNLEACKTTEHLKRIQKAVLVEVIELKKELHLHVPP
nr:hypothetical protein [Tanacetum cinerariifolium]